MKPLIARPPFDILRDPIIFSMVRVMPAATVLAGAMNWIGL
ncbi:Uncharacterized [Moorella glycerini]|uniref:Uncharacterized protein n=1 Tax=Neomoorella stamsii TaxID=1266720 RepID=A0A9X7P7S5_9FIRM|nr:MULTISPECIES: hypothetical protein [Moorella]PRR77582.1 hypothetical protein MOST_01790 [Moorella stamsii]CEP69371.1 Uncharacterized [Moorella glycerini]